MSSNGDGQEPPGGGEDLAHRRMSELKDKLRKRMQEKSTPVSGNEPEEETLDATAMLPVEEIMAEVDANTGDTNVGATLALESDAILG